MPDQPITVALLGNFAGFEALRAALREAGFLIEGDAGSNAAASTANPTPTANPTRIPTANRIPTPTPAVRPAAVIDLSGPDRAELLALARQCYAPLVGLLPAGSPHPRAVEGLDGIVRAPDAAADLPQLLRSLCRACRDRDEARATEAELRKTKEFLERLIDATPDGIVAADLRGRVLLLNKGAERILGYNAAEVVGKMTVSDLSPRGQPQAIMQRLRAARAAGAEVRMPDAALIAKGGETVPVNLSAALVSAGGRETATVGVFTDQRDRLRVEAALAQMQERLAVAEKGALVSELAGAAAHELNQPLTTVVGFADLLLRRGREDDRDRDELREIVRAAEDMAGIVRKIGRIARYETTDYVGARRIVDLDRASQPPPPAAVVIDDRGQKDKTGSDES